MNPQQENTPLPQQHPMQQMPPQMPEQQLQPRKPKKTKGILLILSGPALLSLSFLAAILERMLNADGSLETFLNMISLLGSLLGVVMLPVGIIVGAIILSRNK